MFEVFVSVPLRLNWLDKLIVFFQGLWLRRERYTHIGVLVDGQTMYHATRKGFHRTSLSIYSSGNHTIVGCKKVRVDNRDYSVGYLEGMCGLEYSESQFFGFIFPSFRSWFRNKGEKTICSESTARFLNECSVYDFKDIDFISPRALWENI